MKMTVSFLFSVLFVFLFINSSVFAGTSSTAGGGSVLYCEQNGKIWTELTDLWEAVYLEKFALERSSQPVELQIQQAMTRLKSANLMFYKAVESNYYYVINNKIYLQPPYGLLPPQDVNPIFDIPGCKIDGYMFYDGDRQSVYISQKNDDLLLSNTDRAAGFIHEAIYKTMRDLYGDTNSVRSRRIVGWLFSKESHLTTIPEKESNPNSYSGYLLCQGNQTEFYLFNDIYSNGSPNRHIVLTKLSTLEFSDGLRIKTENNNLSSVPLQSEFLSKLNLNSYRVSLNVLTQTAGSATVKIEVLDPRGKPGDSLPSNTKIFESTATCQRY